MIAIVALRDLSIVFWMGFYFFSLIPPNFNSIFTPVHNPQNHRSARCQAKNEVVAWALHHFSEALKFSDLLHLFLDLVRVFQSNQNFIGLLLRKREPADKEDFRHRLPFG